MKKAPILALILLAAFTAACASGSKSASSSTAAKPTAVPTPPGDKNAPIAVSSDIVVALSPAEVWACLSDVDNWGAWNPKVTAVKASAGLNVGSDLSYRWEEREVKAVVEKFKEGELLEWRGARSGGDVLMHWQLYPNGDNTTVSLRTVLTPRASQTFQANAGAENMAWISAAKAELEKRAAAKPQPVKKAHKKKAPAQAPQP